MLFIFDRRDDGRRAQAARNRQKAQELVDRYGDAAESYVHEKIAAAAWRIRDHAHWKRVEKHVKMLLG
jgi:hypothetical protein